MALHPCGCTVYAHNDYDALRGPPEINPNPRDISIAAQARSGGENAVPSLDTSASLMLEVKSDRYIRHGNAVQQKLHTVTLRHQYRR